MGPHTWESLQLLIWCDGWLYTLLHIKAGIESDLLNTLKHAQHSVNKSKTILCSGLDIADIARHMTAVSGDVLILRSPGVKHASELYEVISNIHFNVFIVHGNKGRILY
jgi:hypothetical protein